MKVLGLIPARGESKSIPRKNLDDLGGLPLIQWTIQAARRSSIHTTDRAVVRFDTFDRCCPSCIGCAHQKIKDTR